jgi:DNA polymerase-3 subunit epsilon
LHDPFVLFVFIARIGENGGLCINGNEMSNFAKPIVMIDFETTGLSPNMGDRVTEVAALRIVGGKVTGRFVSLINCGVRIPPFITGLTGITQAMVNSAPPCSSVIPELVRFIGSDALAAHNAGFDEKFLVAESQMLGLQPAHTGLICSVKLARRVFPGLSGYGLGELSSSLGVRFSGRAHRAEADAEVAAEVLLRVARELDRVYGMASIDPALLVAINKQAAAKVPAFLQKQRADAVCG